AGTRPGDRVAPRGGSRHERATRPARQGDPKPGGNRSRLPCVIKNVTTVQRATTTRSGRPYGRPAPRPPQPARAGFVVLLERTRLEDVCAPFHPPVRPPTAARPPSSCTHKARPAVRDRTHSAPARRTPRCR